MGSAVDSAGQAVEFMPSARRDVTAAKRFFKKMMRADHRRLPFTIGTDKHASFRSFHTTERTSEGIEAMHMMGKG